jgi:hypothetical protein
MKAVRRDPDHLPVNRSDLEALPDDVRIGTESALPDLVVPDERDVIYGWLDASAAQKVGGAVDEAARIGRALEGVWAVPE